MAGRNLTLAVLRTLDRQIQGLAGFVHRQVKQVEKRVEQAVSQDVTAPAPFQPDEGGPPAHWLERVRQVAPGFLEPTSGQPFQSGDELLPPPATPDIAASAEGQIPTAKSSENKVFRFRDQSENFQELPASGPGGLKNQHGPAETNRAGFIPTPGNFSEDNTNPAGLVEPDKIETGPRQQRERRARIVFPRSVSEQGSPSSEQLPPAFEQDSLLPPAPFSGLNFYPAPQDRKKSAGISPAGKEKGQASPKPAIFPDWLQFETREDRKIIEKDELPAIGQPQQQERTINYTAERKTAFAPVNYRASQPEADNYSRQQGQNTKFSYETENKLALNPPVNAPLASRKFFPQSGNSAEIEGHQHITGWSKSGETDRVKTVAGERRWPELPEDEPAERGNWPQVRRKLEHLQRLEEEQRGTYGTGRLFD